MSYFLSTTVPSYSESGTCQLFVFRVPFSQRPALSRCLPLDSSLRKNKLGQRIYAEVDQVEELGQKIQTDLGQVEKLGHDLQTDVDQVEEYGLTTVVLMLVQSLLTVIGVIVWLSKSCRCTALPRDHSEPNRHDNCHSAPTDPTSDLPLSAKPLREVFSDFHSFKRLFTSITISLVFSRLIFIVLVIQTMIN